MPHPQIHANAAITYKSTCTIFAFVCYLDGARGRDGHLRCRRPVLCALGFDFLDEILALDNFACKKRCVVSAVRERRNDAIVESGVDKISDYVDRSTDRWPRRGTPLTEDNVRAVEPRGDDGGDEELRAVGVLARVRHREQEGLVVLDLEILIWRYACQSTTALQQGIAERTSELLAIDGLATGAIALGKVATLQHEIGNHAVEGRARVAEVVLASAELAEVLRGLRHDVVI